EDSWRDSDCIESRAAGTDSFAARRNGSAKEWRTALHFSRRADDAHWADASLSPGPRADHERLGSADYSGAYRRGVGVDFQFCWRKILVEVSAQDSIPRASNVWKTDSFYHTGAGSAAAGAGIGRGRVCGP